MMRSPNLARRVVEPEIMDRLDIDADSHGEALAGLVRLNRAGGATRLVWPTVLRAARAVNARESRPLRLLDLACGAGDLVADIVGLAKESSVSIEACGCDRSAWAVEFARRRAECLGLNATYSVADVVRGPVPSGYDILTCTLFLHHLDDSDALALLAKMGEAAGSAVVVADLRRTWFGLALVWAATRFFSTSTIVRADGPQSVRAAYTLMEAGELARHAGMTGCEIRAKWPARFVLSWEKRS